VSNRIAGADQRPEVVFEIIGHAIAGGIDKVIRHVAGFPGDIREFFQLVVYRIVPGSLDRDRAIQVVPDGVVCCTFAYFAGFSLVNI